MWIFGAILENPEDFAHLLKLKMASMAAKIAIPSDPNLAFCYQILGRTCRSFSIVLQQLSPNLRNPVCVFYLMLRGLEAIEDDMTIDYDVKVALLKDFHKKIFAPVFHIPPCGNNDYKPLMDKFHLIINAFKELSIGYQEIIAEICGRMGEGMVKYLTAEIDSRADYNDYCHYTGGLVGLGLTRLFYTAGVEQFTPDYLSNAMGLFLRKTNLIRDYLEQINSDPKPQRHWPREVWMQYEQDFKDGTNGREALLCLNEMVTDALSHGLDCLQYMASLQDPANLRFCAIPQITALGTLAMCYNNVEAFRGSVQLRRGLTAKILDVKTLPDVYGAFYDFTGLISAKAEGCSVFSISSFAIDNTRGSFVEAMENTDPSASLTEKYVGEIRSVCRFEIKNRRAFTIDSKAGHETCLVLALCILLVVMLLVVSK